MKYFSQKNEGKGLMALPLSFTLFFVILFLAVNFFLFYDKLGVSPQSVANYYLGNEANFQPARSISSMLEVTHGHLAMFALFLLVVTHLAIFSNFTRKWKITLIIGTYSGAFFSEGASWLIRFVHPAFSYLKIAGFLTMQIFIIVSVWGVLQYIQKMKNNGSNRRD